MGSYAMSDIAEQEIRISKMVSEILLITEDTMKRRQDIRYAPWTIVLTCMGAGAALLGAGAALMALFLKSHG
jgi:hypothetical protein